MEQKYCDEDLIRAFKCRICGNYTTKDEAFSREDDGVNMTCVCIDCSTNQYQKFAETFTKNSQTTWSASYQLSKLNYWLDNIQMFIEELEKSKDEEDQNKVRGWKIQKEQIQNAIKGPDWLRKEWAKNKTKRENNA